jgi:hypothetical protein
MSLTAPGFRTDGQYLSAPLRGVAVVLAALVIATSVTSHDGASATESDLAWVSVSPLLAARLGEAVTIPLDVTGGTAPYAISIVSGSLPSGLAISGTSITGTPTVTGTSTFTLRATDVGDPASTVDREFELSIVRGVRKVELQSPGNQRVVLGALASRTQASSTGSNSSTLPNPLTKGWVSISGGSAPFTVTGVDSRTNQTYTFRTDFNYATTNDFWRKEGDERPPVGGSGELYFRSFSGQTHSGRTGIVLLESREWCSTSLNSTFRSYCSMFGPDLWSDSFAADGGESLSFDWAAQGGGDDYESYAFLVNTANNEHTLLAYGRGGTQGWTTSSGLVPADGTYRFRFVNGSYDRSGGGLLGARMFVDPASVQVGSTQTITFPQLPEQSTASGAANVLNLNGVITASSGLPVTLTSSTTNVCTVSGMSVTLVGGGTCTLTANQAGSDLFVPASTVTGSFTVVLKQAQAIVTATLSATSVVYGDSVTVTPGGGSAGAYTVSLSANASCELSGTTVTMTAASGDCAVVVTRAGDATFAERSSAPVSITVAPRPVSVSGAAVADRTYDGTTTVAITSGSLSGVLSGDVVSLSTSPTGASASADVGAHAVSATFALAGPDAAKYSLTVPTLTVTISQRPVTLSLSRPYDGSATLDPSAGGTVSDVTGLVAGESLTLVGVGSVATPAADVDPRPLTLGSIALADATSGPGTAANYVLAGSGHTVTITPRVLTATGSRIYDGTTLVSASDLSLGGLVAGEALSLAGSAVAASADTSIVPANTTVTVTGAEVGLPDLSELRVVVATQGNGRLWLTSSAGLSIITGYTLPTSSGSAAVSIGMRGPRATVLAALRDDLRFTTSSSGAYTVSVQASAGDLTSFTNAEGTRYYRVISNNFANWQAARTAAAAETITLKDGTTANGYLATITSAEENTFIRTYVSQTSWIGASDDVAIVNAALGSTVYANQAAVEGRWHWVTGPEAGTLFSVGNGNPTPEQGRFNAWAGGEPNNAGGEHCGEFYVSGTWNDIPCGASGKPAIVEFGPFPADQDVTTTNVIPVVGAARTLVDITGLALADGPGATGLASNYTLSGGAHGVTILPRTVRGAFTAVGRPFDGTRAAEVLAGSRVLLTDAQSDPGSGVVAGDVGDVSLTGGTATFDDAAVGTRTASLFGATLAGARAFNYILDGVGTTTATIAGRTLTIAPSGTFEVFGGLGRVYDGTTDATITDSNLTLVGVVDGDAVTLVPAAEFVDGAAGVDRQVRISAASVLGGADAANYALDLTGAPTATATIRPRPLTVTGAAVAPRPYDGTTAVTISGASLANTVAGDAVSLVNAASGVAASRDAGTHAVATSMTLTGADAVNYLLVAQPSLTVTIAPLPVGVTMNALPSRPYDGTTAVPLAAGAFTVSGVLPGESIAVSGTAQLVSRSPGARAVTLTAPTFTPGAGTTLANYVLPSSVTGSMTVTPLALRVADATVAQRVWDGTTAATVVGARLEGLRAGDNVTLTGAASGVFASAQPGTHPVRFTPTLVGVDAINYTLVVPELTGTIARAPATLRITGGLTQFADGSPRTVRAAVSPASAGRIVISYAGGSAPSAPGTYAVTVTLDSATHTAEALSATLVIDAVEALLRLPITPAGPAQPSQPSQPTAPVDEERRAQLLARIAVRSDGTLALPQIGPVLEADGTAPAFAPREHRVLEDGEPSAARVTVVDDERVRIATDDDSFSIELQAAVATDDGRIPLPVAADGTLLLDRDGLVEVGGSGFLPGSTAEVWMFSEATFLGTAIVAADGSFTGAFPIDELLAAGEHTLQLNGIGADEQVRSTSLGVRIDDPDAPTRDRVVIATATDTASSSGPLWLLALAALLGAAVTRWWLIGRRRRDEEDEDHVRQLERDAQSAREPSHR